MARFSRFAAAAACALALPGLAQGFGWGSSGAAASVDGRQLLAEAVRVEKEGAVEEEDGRASQEFYGAAIAGWGWRAGWPKRRVKFPQRTLRTLLLCSFSPPLLALRAVPCRVRMQRIGTLCVCQWPWDSVRQERRAMRETRLTRNSF